MSAGGNGSQAFYENEGGNAGVPVNSVNASSNVLPSVSPSSAYTASNYDSHLIGGRRRRRKTSSTKKVGRRRRKTLSRSRSVRRRFRKTRK